MNRNEIIQACRDTNLCKTEFKRLISAKTDTEFVKVLRDNVERVLEELSHDLIKDLLFDWDELNGCGWVNLLQYYPKFHTYCDWSKLDGFNWYCLLINQPQFHIYCDWSELNNYEWYRLVRRYPQFKKYKPENLVV